MFVSWLWMFIHAWCCRVVDRCGLGVGAVEVCMLVLVLVGPAAHIWALFWCYWMLFVCCWVVLGDEWALLGGAKVVGVL